MRTRKALHPYIASNADELTFKTGDIILELGPGPDPGWLKGTVEGRTGLFPEVFTEVVAATKPPTLPARKPSATIAASAIPSPLPPPSAPKPPPPSRPAAVSKPPPPPPPGKPGPSLPHYPKVPSSYRPDAEDSQANNAAVSRAPPPPPPPKPGAAANNNQQVSSNAQAVGRLMKEALAGPNSTTSPSVSSTPGNGAGRSPAPLPVASRPSSSSLTSPSKPPPPPPPPKTNGHTSLTRPNAVSQQQQQPERAKAPPPPPPPPSSIVTPQSGNPIANKKPPPPPPASSLQQPVASRAPPPPPAAIPSSPMKPSGPRFEKFDLPARSMKTMEPPPAKYCTAGEDTYACSASISSFGPFTEKTEVYEISRSDRSEVKLTIVQRSGESKAEGTAEIRPFVPLSQAQLIESSEKYGPAIVQFCKNNLNKRVGDGECWSLGKHAFEFAGCSPPIAKNFGQEIALEDARPGDILQFHQSVFEYPDGRKQMAGAPDHTAVVRDFAQGKKIQVYEQNPNPVSPGEYNFAYLKSGSVVCYRCLPPKSK